jgi:hypothetical protein
MKIQAFNLEARKLIAKCYDTAKNKVEGSTEESDDFFELADGLMQLEAKRRGEKWKE